MCRAFFESALVNFNTATSCLVVVGFSQFYYSPITIEKSHIQRLSSTSGSGTQDPTGPVLGATNSKEVRNQLSRCSTDMFAYISVIFSGRCWQIMANIPWI